MRDDVSAKPCSTRNLDGSSRSERRYPLFWQTQSEELCPEMNSPPAMQFKWTPPSLSTCHRVDGLNGRATHSVGSTEFARLLRLNRYGVAHRSASGRAGTWPQAPDTVLRRLICIRYATQTAAARFTTRAQPTNNHPYCPRARTGRTSGSLDSPTGSTALGHQVPGTVRRGESKNAASGT